MSAPTRGRVAGLALVAGSAVLWSTAGLFVRMADLDTGTMVAWRSVFAALVLGGVAAAQRRGRLRRSLAAFGWPEGVSVALAVLSTFSYVVALRLTSVANVMTVFAALPFIAGSIAFAWLGERLTARFIVAGTVALAGIALMAGAVSFPGDLLGIGAALVMTTGFAAQLVHTKRHPGLDLLLVIAVAALVCVPLSLPFARGGVPSPVSLLACALYGTLTTGLAYVLALRGGRLISSGEAGLISLLEVVLGPAWVWGVFGERPGGVALASGALVLAAVGGYLAAGPAASPPASRTGSDGV